MNPVDEYFMTKAAAEGGWGQALRNAAVHTGAGLALAGAPILASKAYNAIAKGSRFNNMLENNEDLQAMHQQDPKRFSLMFDSLHNMSPTFASDPLVAGSYMRKMMANPANAGGVLVDARNQTKPSDPGALVRSMQGMAPSVAKDIAATSGKASSRPEERKERSPQQDQE